MKINLVMIVKNEERSIERSLSAVAPLVNDMVIVDTGSTDRTKDIVKRIGNRHAGGTLRLYDYEWQDDFSAARNFALEKSDTDGAADYNLVLDADEYLQPFLMREFYAFIHRMEDKYGKNWSGAIKRIDSFGEGDAARITAIVRLHPAGVRYRGVIHEQPVTSGPCILTSLVAEHDGYLQKGKGERNLEYLRRTLEETPGDPYLNYQMGITLRNLGQNTDSLPYFEKFYRSVNTEKAGDNGDIAKASDRTVAESVEDTKCADDLQDENGSEYVTDGILQYLYALKDTGTEQNLNLALHIVEAEEGRFTFSTDFYFYCALFYVELVKSDIARYMDYLPRIEACYQKCLEIGEGSGMSGVVGTGSFLALYNLGLWYELNNQMKQALSCYRKAEEMGYAPAEERRRHLDPESE
uniref:glycosyltransferase n=1 Tax=Eubacterium cellulosolvens TaxID=29322 RepID=UPI00047F5AE1|nr:glycosyltransferase [[Eubacterium] cellulosolvens]